MPLTPDKKDQEEIAGINTFRACYCKSKYNPETYPKIAYEVLSKKAMQSKSHLGVALRCAKSTIILWMKRYPEFKEAVEKGLSDGEAKFRDKLKKHAFIPSSQVNNGLIKLMAANVYGIKEEAPTVIINNTNSNNPEQTLKERGIPLPKLAIGDIEDEEKNCDMICEACEEPCDTPGEL